jgi:hypothetical protein
MERTEPRVVHSGAAKLDRLGHNLYQIGLVFYPFDGVLGDHDEGVYHTAWI